MGDDRTDILGLGSFFHEVEYEELDYLGKIKFNYEYQFLHSGRHALKYCIEAIKLEKEISSIWLPDYYCPYVKDWMEHNYDNITYYKTYPFSSESVIDWNIFGAQDVVVLNNYWGLLSSIIPENKLPVVIEDHSHGWLSDGCLSSKADYCFASLRKSVPLPLGGIVWSPRDLFDFDSVDPLILNQNEIDFQEMNSIWEGFKNAMKLKRNIQDPEKKEVYLNSYSKNETALRKNNSLVPLIDSQRNQLDNYAFLNYLTAKQKNLSYIQRYLKESEQMTILKGKYNGTPFGLLILFKIKEELELFKKHLISNSIYPALLWPIVEGRGEFKHLLNIHVDYRYGPHEMDKIIKAVTTFSN